MFRSSAATRASRQDKRASRSSALSEATPIVETRASLVFQLSATADAASCELTLRAFRISGSSLCSLIVCLTHKSDDYTRFCHLHVVDPSLRLWLKVGRYMTFELEKFRAANFGAGTVQG